MRFSELEGLTVGVWGAGREVRSFATQLARRLPSARIAVVALDGEGDLPEAPGARVVRGAGIVPALGGCDVVVRSPGVSIHRPELRALRVPVVTATGLWLAERGGRRAIGITGTKGKSTTAALASHLARAAGEPAHLAGNIGAPALDLLDADPGELAVVELSSYQIADLDVGPEVAVVTNLFREHVDWHGSHEAYRAEKLRILGLPGVRAKVVHASLADTAPEATVFGTDDGWNASREGVTRGGELVVAASDLPLRGVHNALNVCAALAALEAAHVELSPFPDALRGFQGLPHRLEVVAEADGVLWVDDSISTTPESALAAIASFGDRELVLVGGGHDRGQDYAELGRALAARNAAVIGLPTTGARLVEAARRAGATEAVEAADMEMAVARAREVARPGSVVLLSPAAPSYNAYRDFEERGDHFRRLAKSADG